MFEGLGPVSQQLPHRDHSVVGEVEQLQPLLEVVGRVHRLDVVVV